MDETSVRYEGWRVVAASGVGVFVTSVVVVTFAVFLKPISEEFSWSRETVSSAFGIAAVMAGLSAAPLGHLFDRFGARRIVVPALLVLGCTFGSLAALTPRVWHLYVASGLLGAAGISTSVMAYARTIATWFDRRRGTALALVITGASLGGIVHPPATQALIGVIGWRRSYALLGAAMLAIGVPMALRFVRERPSTRSVSEPPAGVSPREGLRTRIFWTLIVVLFCSSMIQNAAIVHLPALLTDRGVPAGRSAIALSTMAAAAIIGRLVTGWLIDRWFAARIAFVTLAITALGTFLLSDAHSFAMGAVSAALIGIGVGSEADVVPYLLSRYFGLRFFSTLYGFTWIATAFAAAAGPILMGRAFDATGTYEAILVRLAAIMLAAAALMLTMPDYTVRPAQAVSGV